MSSAPDAVHSSKLFIIEDLDPLFDFTSGNSKSTSQPATKMSETPLSSDVEIFANQSRITQDGGIGGEAIEVSGSCCYFCGSINSPRTQTSTNEQYLS